MPGRCDTGREDLGLHLVCVRVSDEFLAFSRERGNDLSTPAPQHQFPGLAPGDRWCLCVNRWKEALEARCAPRVLLSATHISALEFVTLEELRQHGIDESGRNGGRGRLGD